MNLYETGALVTPNTGVDQQETVLEVAQREGIAVLVNRPLNAMPTKKSGVASIGGFSDRRRSGGLRSTMPDGRGA